jgi:NAD(P)-dependent dehydrogenase (short-subunit alcohol dehydrogenase family)
MQTQRDISANIEARNFAGIGGQANSIADGDVEGFRRVMEINVTGSFICTKYQMKQMLQQDPISTYVRLAIIGRPW